MKKFNKLIIACDGESASGKSTAAKLISKKYGLLLVNSGLLYRYASKLVIDHKPKNEVEFLNRKFKKISYKKISFDKDVSISRVVSDLNAAINLRIPYPESQIAEKPKSIFDVSLTRLFKKNEIPVTPRLINRVSETAQNRAT